MDYAYETKIWVLNSLVDALAISACTSRPSSMPNVFCSVAHLALLPPGASNGVYRWLGYVGTDFEPAAAKPECS